MDTMEEKNYGGIIGTKRKMEMERKRKKEMETQSTKSKEEEKKIRINQEKTNTCGIDVVGLVYWSWVCIVEERVVVMNCSDGDDDDGGSLSAEQKAQWGSSVG